jgi:hypothetical protein
MQSLGGATDGAYQIPYQPLQGLDVPGRPFGDPAKAAQAGTKPISFNDKTTSMQVLQGINTNRAQRGLPPIGPDDPGGFPVGMPTDVGPNSPVRMPSLGLSHRLPLDSNGQAVGWKGKGFWQHMARIGEGIGNVAGDIFAPGTMALIPGTQMNRDFTYNRDIGQVAGIQEAQSKAAEDAARIAQEQALTKETTQKTDDAAHKTAVEKAEGTVIRDQNGKPIGWADYDGIMYAAPQSGGAWDPKVPSSIQSVLGQDQGKAPTSAIEAFFEKTPRPTPEEAQKFLENGRAKTPQEQTFADLMIHGDASNKHQPMSPVQAWEKVREKPATINTGDKGGWAIPDVNHPGQFIPIPPPAVGVPLPPGAVNLAGASGINADAAKQTNAMKTRSAIVADSYAALGNVKDENGAIKPGIMNLIDQNRDDIGPIEGRLNSALITSGFSRNESLGSLVSQLELLKTGIGMAHYGVRGGPEDFRKTQDRYYSIEQDPKMLKAHIEGGMQYLQHYKNLSDAQKAALSEDGIYAAEPPGWKAPTGTVPAAAPTTGNEDKTTGFVFKGKTSADGVPAGARAGRDAKGNVVGYNLNGVWHDLPASQEKK